MDGVKGGRGPTWQNWEWAFWSCERQSHFVLVCACAGLVFNWMCLNGREWVRVCMWAMLSMCVDCRELSMASLWEEQYAVRGTIPGNSPVWEEETWGRMLDKDGSFFFLSFCQSLCPIMPERYILAVKMWTVLYLKWSCKGFDHKCSSSLIEFGEKKVKTVIFITIFIQKYQLFLF